MASFKHARPPTTVSHWIASNSGPKSLHNHGRNDALPETADIVIVGAGITGALISYYLSRPDGEEGSFRGKSIVILEGSEVASGATGRNGGHFAPATFHSYASLTKPKDQGGCGLSKSQAVHILKKEWDNFILNKDLIKKWGLQDKVDLWEGISTTIYSSEEELENAKRVYADWVEAIEEHGTPDWSDNRFYTNQAEVEKMTRVKGVVGCSTRSVGTVHPHKLVTEILKLSLSSEQNEVSLFTNAPVLEIVDSKDDIQLQTPRGTIRAGKVILCTNAHTQHLFPSGDPIKTFIFPTRQQMGLFTPPTDFSGEKSLMSSYGFAKGYCATAQGGIVVGISERIYAKDCDLDGSVFIDNSDDSTLPEASTEYLKSFMERTLIGWEEKAIGEGLTRTWMGVKGHTIDRLPLIGAVPDRPGLFIAAGFNGHGMSTTHVCAKALVRLIVHGDWCQDFPTAYILTPERLRTPVPEAGLVSFMMNR